MSLKYAIRKERTAPVTSEEQVGFEASNYSEKELDFTYEEVPKHVADKDVQNGMFAVFLDNGIRVTEWIINTPTSTAAQLPEEEKAVRAVITYSLIIGSPFVVVAVFMLLLTCVDALTKLFG